MKKIVTTPEIEVEEDFFFSDAIRMRSTEFIVRHINRRIFSFEKGGIAYSIFAIL